MNNEQIDTIINKLNYLKLNDTNYSVFGSLYHQYDLNEKISETEIDDFENLYEIELPIDYRIFLTKIGNGGAGPNYGLLPLHVSPDNSIFNLFPFLGFEFGHRKKWNKTSEIDSVFNQLYNHQNKEVSKFFSHLEQFSDILQMAGAIYISDCGDNWRQYLVITGEERGNIWFDQRVDGEGLFPLTDSNNNRLSFYNWYNQWLEQSIEKVKDS